ncbi:MAG: hypothetical protein ACYSTG_01490 [Planctomycetota bacterium]|jgi:hypothetical protein
MLGVLSELLYNVVGWCFSLLPLLAYILIFRYIVRRSNPLALTGVVDFLRFARWFLALVAYPFVLLATTVAFLLTDIGLDAAQLCLLLFVAFPLFFMFAYLLGGTQMSLMLNLMLYKCHRQNSVLVDKEAAASVRKTVKHWLWLHKPLSAFRKVKLTEVLKTVCPLE